MSQLLFRDPKKPVNTGFTPIGILFRLAKTLQLAGKFALSAVICDTCVSKFRCFKAIKPETLGFTLEI